ncbi:phage holin family protein [Streptomyces sp. NPDC021056]|uniref:phage holin family protein n=1 Tax=Streptomyces sp. NPDC021056 TaxID=3155012 RepID=UPI0034043F44
MHKRRRTLGTYLGVGLAAALLPGISAVADGPFWQTMLAGIVFLVVNQLIHTYPSAIRSAPAVMLLILAAIGIVQDTLVWLLVSWLSGQMDSGLHVDGFLTALLGGVVTRAVTLAVMALGPQPEPA